MIENEHKANSITPTPLHLFYRTWFHFDPMDNRINCGEASESGGRNHKSLQKRWCLGLKNLGSQVEEIEYERCRLSTIPLFSLQTDETTRYK